jgi:tetratricopeptide (TPR) repeat protein
MRRVTLANLLWVVLLWVAITGVSLAPCWGDPADCPGAAIRDLPASQVAETGALEIANRGMNKLMDGDFDAATQAFRQIQQLDPESPLGYLLEADASWWKIYLTEGDLVDPDVFEALSEAPTAYDDDFRRSDDLAIRKAEVRLEAQQDEARNDFYAGLAYALRAQLEALRDHALATARAGKKMRNLSLAALKLDPNLNDAWFGVGLYNYFVDTLPTYVKMLRFLILLPGGDRLEGLRQMEQAMDKGQLVTEEAKFHLAKNYSRPIDRQYARSLELFRQMQQQFPHNPLWKLLVGSVELRMGNVKEGEELYRQVVAETVHPSAEMWKPLHQQAERALARRSGH